MSHKAPSAGTKVSAGPGDAPIQEGPGAVKPDSLAAESEAFRQANMGGLESQQRHQRPQEGGSAPYPQGAMPGETGRGGEGGGARAAPTYVENQFRRDPSGAHGKNITEETGTGEGKGEGEEGDDAKNASFSAEIGSRDDPSLLAERKFFQANAAAPGVR